LCRSCSQALLGQGHQSVRGWAGGKGESGGSIFVGRDSTMIYEALRIVTPGDEHGCTSKRLIGIY